MIEEIELRCDGDVRKYMDRTLDPIIEDIGDEFYSVLKIVLKPDDPRWEKILFACKMYAQKREEEERQDKIAPKPWHLKALDDMFDDISGQYHERAREKGWKLREGGGYSFALVRRKYVKSELREAKLLFLLPFISTAAGREPEEDTLIYDQSAMCPLCRAGQLQKSDLIFDLTKMPKSKDIVGMYGYECEEIIISDRLADLMKEHQITGFKLRPVHHKTKRLKKSSKWHQLIITSNVGVAAEQTQYGEDPFNVDTKQEDACSCGRTSGVSIISELYVHKSNWDGSDIAVTTNLVGGGKALGFPQPLIVISQKLYQLLIRNNIKGLNVEVVHLV